MTPELNALNQVAKKLKVSPKKLYMLINFESRFNPFAKNPKSSARGLLQFIDQTSIDLGYKNSLDLINKHPSVISQLKTPVYNYLSKYKPFKNSNDLFLTVLYPKARKWSIYRKFPDIVPFYNPGIYRPIDYIKKIYKFNNMKYVSPLLYLTIASLLLSTLSRIRKHGKKKTF
ncbi:transglycosylase SLT domain-containing protein [archaeon]|nr:transglycosylase SLT domain-containing protein [archaeon]